MFIFAGPSIPILQISYLLSDLCIIRYIISTKSQQWLPAKQPHQKLFHPHFHPHPPHPHIPHPHGQKPHQSLSIHHLVELAPALLSHCRPATMERTICHTFLWKPQYFPILFGFTTWNTFATLLCKTFHILELTTRFGLKRLKMIYKEFLVWLFSILHGKDPMQKLARQLTRERERAKICPEG